MANLLFLIVFLEIALIIGSAGYKLYYLALNTNVLRTKTIELQKKTEISDTVNLLNDEAKKLEGQLLDEKSYFFTDRAMLQFFKDLELKASNYGILLSSVSFGNLVPISESLTDLKTLSISFSMSGSYSNINRFIGSLENSRPIVKPTQFSFSLQDVQSPETTGTISATISFFVETKSSGKWSFQGE